jgi:hypothetical protein
MVPDSTRARQQAALEQLAEGLDCNASHEGGYGEDSVKRAGIQRILQRNSNALGGMS